jgi:hypothetical protein
VARVKKSTKVRKRGSTKGSAKTARSARAKSITEGNPAAKSPFTPRPAVLVRYETDAVAVKKATGGDPKKLTPKVLSSLGMSKGKAERMLTYANTKPEDRLYTKGLTRDQLGAEIVRLRDVEGLPMVPDIWARTLVSPETREQLYREFGGTKEKRVRGVTKPKVAKKTTKKTVGRKSSAKASRGNRKTSRRQKEK